nr:hydrogenase expression/formation protein [Gammaproteobacteria bacterium]
EVADVPGLVSEMTFADAVDNIDISQLDIPQDVYNAAPLLTEIHDRLAQRPTGSEPHIINLSLLPHTEQDLAYLSDQLGIGPIIILSRGYGNCRISSTLTRNVWWVQYFNSQETLILNTLEISPVPEVACASQEDIQDSAQRLQEILSIY